MDHSVPSLNVTTSAPGLGRRSLISAALLGLLTACGSGTGGSADGRRVRTVLAPDPDLPVRTRAHAATLALAARYDAVLLAFPDLSGRLAPLRAQVGVRLAAFAAPAGASASTAAVRTGSPSPSGSPSLSGPGSAAAASAAGTGGRAAALPSLDAAERETAAAHLADLELASPALARQLAAAAAGAAQHAMALRGSVPAGPSAAPVGTARLPAPALAALQAALAAEDAAVYAYGVVGAQLDGARRTRATASYQAHRARRGALQQRITAAGAVPVAAAPAYRLPSPVADPASAVRLAGLVEARTCAVYANAVQATTGPMRGAMAAALRQSALDCYAWRGSGSALPGLPDE